MSADLDLFAFILTLPNWQTGTPRPAWQQLPKVDTRGPCQRDYFRSGCKTSDALPPLLATSGADATTAFEWAEI